MFRKASYVDGQLMKKLVRYHIGNQYFIVASCQLHMSHIFQLAS